MFDVMRENPRRAALVLIPVGLVAALYVLLALRYSVQQNSGHSGALLDDTWIHVRFAANIGAGRGLSYNDGVLTTGATSPLWVLALGGVLAVFDLPPAQQINAAIILSMVGHVLSVLAAAGFGWWVTRRAWVGFAAGMITALTGRYVWMGLSGMEITTFTLFCILTVWSHTHDRRAGRVFGWRTGILAALATLARPEGYLLAALVMADAFGAVLLRAYARGELAAAWGRLRAGWRGLTAYLLLAGSYPLASLLISGYPLPNTFRVKSNLGREWPELPRTFFWQPNVDFGPVLIVLAALGTAYVLWRAFTRRDDLRDDSGLIWGVWPSLFVLGVLFMGADRFVVNNSRYVAPAIPFQALAAVVGVMALCDGLVWWTARRDRQPNPAFFDRLLPGGLCAVLMLLTFVHGTDQAAQVASDVRQLRTMHVQAADFIARNTGPDDLIALNDVGAIVHLTNRRVLDLEGLVSAEVIAATAGTANYTCPHDLALMRLMLDHPPALIGVFPWWYPCMTGWPGALQPFAVFSITGRTVIGGGELVIYWPVWENWPVRAALPADVIPVDANFAQGISLAAYTTEVTDGGLLVTLWWRASAQPDGDYNVFTHLIDAQGTIISQHDGIPQERFVTSWWRAGDIIADTHLIPLAADADLTGLALRVGLYIPPDGPRLGRSAAPDDAPDFVVIVLGDSP